MRLRRLVVLLAVGLGCWALFDAAGFYQGSAAVVRWLLFAVIVVGAVLSSRGPRWGKPSEDGTEAG